MLGTTSIRPCRNSTRCRRCDEPRLLASSVGQRKGRSDRSGRPFSLAAEPPSHALFVTSSWSRAFGRLGLRGGIHPYDLPDIAVGVLDGAIEHEAVILCRIGVGAAARGGGPGQRRAHGVAAVYREREQAPALAPGVADRPLGKLAIAVVGQQHHADRVREHHRRRLLIGKLLVHLAAQRDVERGRGREVTDRQVHEDHFAHHFLLYCGRESRYCLNNVLVDAMYLSVKILFVERNCRWTAPISPLSNGPANAPTFRHCRWRYSTACPMPPNA